MSVTASLSDLLLTHRALRAETRALAAALAEGAPVRRARVATIRDLLRRHHAYEAQHLFPLVAGRLPGFPAPGLVADHEELETVADEVADRLATGDTGGAAAGAARLAEMVAQHLDDEERVVVPAWTGLSPADDAHLVAVWRRTLGWRGRARLAPLLRADGPTPPGPGRRAGARGRRRGTPGSPRGGPGPARRHPS